MVRLPAQKLLDAVTTTGASSAVWTDGTPHSKWGLQVILGGTVAATGAVVKLEGTLDGSHYFVIATWDLAAPLSSGDIVFAVDKPVTKVRANCTTLSGGTSPTLTAWVVGA